MKSVREHCVQTSRLLVVFHLGVVQQWIVEDISEQPLSIRVYLGNLNDLSFVSRKEILAFVVEIFREYRQASKCNNVTVQVAFLPTNVALVLGFRVLLRPVFAWRLAG